jgi:hypothetical protein
MLAYACSPFDGYQSALDGGAQSAVTACESIGVPERPSFASHAGVLDFTVGVRTYDFGEEVDEGVPRVARIGFDLDHECTDENGPAACMIAPGVPRIDQTDAPGGIDNAYGTVLHKIAAGGGASVTQNSNDGVDSGFLSLAIRVRNYSGLPVDPQVEVSVYAISTLETPPIGEGVRPIWDGDDEWRAVDLWLESGSDGTLSVDRAKYRDERAYVINGQLVARFERLGLSIFVASQAVVTGDLVRNDDGTFELLRGTVAARLSADELLSRTELRPNPTTGDPFCIGTPGYAEEKETLCSIADVSFDGPDDGSQTCDGLSWQFRFNAEPIQIVGIARTDDAYVPPCPADTSTIDDSCSTLSD